MKIVDEMLAAVNALSAAGHLRRLCGPHSRVFAIYLAKVGFDEDTGTLGFKNERQDLIHVTPAIGDVWVKRMANREQDLADI